MLYRLIYEGSSILALTEAIGVTVGPASTFDGTAQQVLEQVAALNLQDPDGVLSLITSV